MTDLAPRLPAHAARTIAQFLRAHAGGTEANGVVVALSGGIDSAVTARLARDALGPERVFGVLLPGAGYPDALRAETEAYARSLGIASRTIPIGAIEAAYRAALPDLADRVTVGNVTARIRMTALYAIARDRGALVAGTGNKSELLLGYFTKFGDGGVDLLPIGDLYKTQERALAAELDLPAAIRERAPTAGFWEGQSDEAELGFRYEDADRILHGLEELRTEAEIVAATGLPAETVRAVAERVARNRHKRRLPPIPKLGLRTVGLDWRD